MCGIAGYYTFGNTVPTVKELKVLLKALSNRGTDATGIGYGSNKEFIVWKNNTKAKVFCNSKFWNKLKIPKTMILHTRAATVGTPEDNKNNHPLLSNKHMVVHNGMIHNHATILPEKKTADVDSEAILRLLDESGDTLKGIKKVFTDCTGSFACAVLNTKNHLYLFKNHNPIEIIYFPDIKLLVFASRAEYINRAFKDRIKYSKNFNITYPTNYVNYDNFDDNDVMKITNEGINKVFTYKPPKPKYIYSNNDYETKYNYWQYTENGYVKTPRTTLADEKDLFDYNDSFKQPTNNENKLKCNLCNKEIDNTDSVKTKVQIADYYDTTNATTIDIIYNTILRNNVCVECYQYDNSWVNY